MDSLKTFEDLMLAAVNAVQSLHDQLLTAMEELNITEELATVCAMTTYHTQFDGTTPLTGAQYVIERDDITVSAKLTPRAGVYFGDALPAHIVEDLMREAVHRSAYGLEIFAQRYERANWAEPLAQFVLGMFIERYTDVWRTSMAGLYANTKRVPWLLTKSPYGSEDVWHLYENATVITNSYSRSTNHLSRTPHVGTMVSIGPFISCVYADRQYLDKSRTRLVTKFVKHLNKLTILECDIARTGVDYMNLARSGITLLPGRFLDRCFGVHSIHGGGYPCRQPLHIVSHWNNDSETYRMVLDSEQNLEHWHEHNLVWACCKYDRNGTPIEGEDDYHGYHPADDREWTDDMNNSYPEHWTLTDDQQLAALMTMRNWEMMDIQPEDADLGSLDRFIHGPGRYPEYERSMEIMEEWDQPAPKRQRVQGQVLGFDTAAITTAAKEITDTMKTVSDAVPQFEATATKMGDLSDRANRMMDTVTDTISGIPAFLDGKLQNILDSLGLGSLLGVFGQLSILFADIWSGVYNNLGALDKWIRIIFRTFFSLGLAHLVTPFLKWAKPYYDKISGFFKSGSTERVEGQGGNDAPGIILAGLVGTVLADRVPDSGKTSKHVTDIARTFNTLVPAADKLSGLLKFFIEHLPDCITRWIRVLCPSTWWAENIMNGDFKRTADEILHLTSTAERENLLFDKKRQQRVKELYKIWQKLKQDGAVELRDAKGSKWFQYVVGIDKELRAAVDTVEQIQKAQATRVTPFCVYQFGVPGCGKSTLASMLAKMMAPPGTADENIAYSRNSATKFWDGFWGQPGIIFDDYGQIKDGTDPDELINIISNQTYIPPMASLNDPAVGMKGTPCAPLFVILNSNVSYPRHPSRIQSTEAIWRRRHLLAEFIVPTTADGLNADVTKRNTDWSHVTVNLRDPLVSDPARNLLEEGLTIAEYCIRVNNMYRQHMAKERAVLAMKKDDTPLNELINALRVTGQGVDEDLAETQERFLADLGVTTDDTYWTGKNFVRNEDIRGPAAGLEPVDFDAFMETIKRSDRSFLSVFAEARMEEVKRLTAKANKWLEDHPRLALAAKVAKVVALVATPFLLMFGLYKAVRERRIRIMIKEIKTDPTFERFTHAYVEFMDLSESGERKDLTNKEVYLAHMKEIMNAWTELAFLESQWVEQKSSTFAGSCELLFNRDLVDEVCRRLRIRRAVGQMEVMIEETPSRKTIVQQRLFLNELLDECEDTHVKAMLTGMVNHVENLEREFEKPGFVLEDWAKKWQTMAMELDFMHERRIAQSEDQRTSGFIAGITAAGNNQRGTPKANTRSSKGGRELPKSWRATGQLDATTDTIVQNVLNPNLGQITATYHYCEDCKGTGKCDNENQVRTNRMRMLGFCNYILTPAHVFIRADGSVLPAETRIDLRFADGLESTFSFDPAQMNFLYRGEDQADIVVYYLGLKSVPRKDIRTHFATEAECNKMTTSEGGLVRATFNGKIPTVSILNLSTLAKQRIAEVDYDVWNYGKNYTLIGGWQYNELTAPGDCGSVLVSSNRMMQSKIIGMHVAGGPGTNYSERITQEMIMKATDRSGRVDGQGVLTMDDQRDDVSWDFSKVYDVPEGNFRYEGVVPPMEAVRMPPHTQIIPSPIHDLVQVHTTEPAPLTPSDPRMDGRVPMLSKGVAKHGIKKGYFRHKNLKRATQGLSDAFNALPVTQQLFGLRTAKEAINGSDRENDEGLEMTTSPGRPYIQRRPVGAKGKEFLFKRGEDGLWDISDVELQHRVDYRMKCLAEGIVDARSEWTAALKDERRPMDKIKIGKTRVFILPPVDYTIVGKMLFHDFTTFFYQSKLKLMSAIGINPEGRHWTSMWNKLKAKGTRGFAGDCVNFDGSLKAELIEANGIFINNWYENCFKQGMLYPDLDFEEAMVKLLREQLMRMGAHSDLIYTLICVLRLLIRTAQANPSGCFMTSILNTDCNILAFLWTYLEVAPPEYNDPSIFFKEVGAFFYGDDNIIVTNDAILKFWNANVVAEKFISIGMGLTPPNKNAKFSENGIAEATSWSFLKRNTRQEGRNWFPMIEEQTILELTNWIKKNDDMTPWEQCTTNCLQALRFAYFYGEEYYENLRDKIQRAYQLRGGNYVFPSWSYFNELFGLDQGLPVLVYYADTLYHERVRGQADHPTDARADMPEAGEATISKLGVIESHQTEIIPTTTIEQHNAARAGKNLIGDMDWTVSDVVAKPVPLGTSIVWTEAQTAGTVLAKYLAPWNMITNGVTHAPFTAFSYWHGTVRMRFTLTGSKYHQGQLIIAYFPMINKDDSDSRYFQNMQALTAVAHGFLDPSVSNSVELDIPFVNPHYGGFCLTETYAQRINNFEFLGTVVVSVANALQAAEGASSMLNIKVMVEFNDARFAIPNANGTFDGLRIDPIYRVQGQGNFYSTINQNIKKAGDVTNGQTSTAAEIGRGSKNTAKLDKPSIQTEPPLIARRQFGFLANAANITHEERAALIAGDIDTVTKETFATTEDVASMNHLKGIWSFMPGFANDVLKWSDATPSGTLLCYGTIDPMCPWQDTTRGAIYTGNDNVFPLTNLQWLSAKWRMWSGSIKFRIQVVSTEFHKGILYFYNGAGNYKSGALTYQEATSGYGMYLDLAESKKTWEITIPFQAPHLLEIQNSNTKTITEMVDTIVGKWAIFVVNELTLPPGFPNTVSINVSICAGDDFQVWGLGGNNRSIVAVGNRLVAPPPPRVQGQGDNNVVAASRDQMTFDRQEEIENLAEIGKRFGRGRRNQTRLAYNAQRDIYQVVTPIDPWREVFGVSEYDNLGTTSNVESGSANSSAMSWYARAFRGAKGGVRVRINTTQNTETWNTYNAAAIVGTMGNSGTVYALYDQAPSDPLEVPNAQYMDFFLGALPSATNQGENNQLSCRNQYSGALQVMVPGDQGFLNIPFYNPYSFALIPQNNLDQQKMKGTEICSIGTLLVGAIADAPTRPYGEGNGPKMTFETYVSFSDETQMGLFLGPPLAYILPTGTWPDYYLPLSPPPLV